MTGETTVFPNRADFNSVIVYYHYLMGQEAATDGWEKEFEDLVDLMIITLHTVFDEGHMAKWEKIDDRGSEEDMELFMRDPIKYGLKKRKRIKEKLMLAAKVIHKNKMGFKHIKEFTHDFDPEKIDQEVEDGPP